MTKAMIDGPTKGKDQDAAALETERPLFATPALRFARS
jgi:hypothetical protein